MIHDPRHWGASDLVRASPRRRAKAEGTVRSRKGTLPVRLLRIGIANPAQVRARSIAIAKGEIRPGRGEPRLWIPSVEALGRILSTPNLAMLDAIRDRRPETIKVLASLIGRAPSNVLRTLRTLERLGLVGLHPAGGHALRPEVMFDRVAIDLDLTSPDAVDHVPAAGAE